MVVLCQSTVSRQFPGPRMKIGSRADVAVDARMGPAVQQSGNRGLSRALSATPMSAMLSIPNFLCTMGSYAVSHVCLCYVST